MSYLSPFSSPTMGGDGGEGGRDNDHVHVHEAHEMEELRNN